MSVFRRLSDHVLVWRRWRARAGSARLAARLRELSGRGGREVATQTARAARFLRWRTRPEKLNRDYRHFLHLAQELLYDRGIEKLFFVPTRGYVPLGGLTIEGPNKAHGHDYHPVHRLSFNWAMAQIPDELKDFSFVDFGAGRGRALLLAAMHPFRQVNGAEFARELHEEAELNIAQFPRSLMKCRDVNCRLMDAVDFPVPTGKAVLFFNDSFDETVLEVVLARIAASYKDNPRRIYLIFVHPVHARFPLELIRRQVVFEPIYHSRSEKLRLQLLSPDQVQVFRTLV